MPCWRAGCINAWAQLVVITLLLVFHGQVGQLWSGDSEVGGVAAVALASIAGWWLVKVIELVGAVVPFLAFIVLFDHTQGVLSGILRGAARQVLVFGQVVIIAMYRPLDFRSTSSPTIF